MAAQDDERDDEVESFKMSLVDHLEELRTRLIYAIIAVFTLAIVAYAFKEPLLYILIQPLQDSFQVSDLIDKVRAWLLAQGVFEPGEVERMVRVLAPNGLIFIHPVEAFFSYLKLSLYTGLLVGMPVVLFQVWKFVMPALYRHERRYFVNMLVFGSFLFYLGVAFCFLLVLPLALKFLIGIGGPILTPMFTMGNYISFSMLFMLVFGLSFEMPLVMYVLVKLGIVEHRTLVEQWRFVLLGAFVVGAMFTPPDVFTQVAMASSIIVLYGVGLLLTRFAQPAAEEESEEAEAPV
jgi:sec-independent protein translocase protein TatC